MQSSPRFARCSPKAGGTQDADGPPMSAPSTQSPCACGAGLKYSYAPPMHYPLPPSAREEARQSTLSWFMRALNGLEPKEQRELLRQILGTCD